MHKRGTVAILLCTYQGERYLEEQLDSFARQTYQDWIVYVSDDGSRDTTLSILNSYIAKWGNDRLVIYPGPKKGFAANFMSLVYNKNINAAFYAFSDQDDIWENDKLERAVTYLKNINSNTPALYCSRTRLVDANNNELGFTQGISKPPCFKNALVQNIAGGNTMVFNDAARNLLQKINDSIKIPLHDWWVYLMVTGCGGEVMYDTYPGLRYRQHGRNQIGAGNDWKTLVERVKQLLDGRFMRINELNMNALSKIEVMLLPENKICFYQFKAARTQWFIPRFFGLIKSGVFSQTLKGNMKLLMAAVLKKI